MLGDVEEQDDYLDLLNLLDSALKEPINLLEADEGQIGGLPWVSPMIAARIVALRREGGLTSVDDLGKVDGMNRRLVELLRPFVIVEPPKRRPSPVRGLLRARVISSPPSGRFERLKTYLRSEVGYGDWRAGLIHEKDKGEARFNDFQSYYLERTSGWGTVTLGDFVLASGHGLVFSGPYGHAPSTVSPWRFSRGEFGLRPYTSVEENFAMRGIGVWLDVSDLDICLAASRSSFDAGLDEDGRVKSLNATGYHTTEAQLEAKDALEENLLGLATRYVRGPLVLRFNLAQSDFNKSFAEDDVRGLSKNGNLTGSVDLTLTGDRSMIFVEAAAARRGDEAYLGGLAADWTSVDFLFIRAHLQVSEAFSCWSASNPSRMDRFP
jgi:hypothetical protein